MKTKATVNLAGITAIGWLHDMEKFSCYEFEIKCEDLCIYGDNTGESVKGYFYVIYDPEYIPHKNTVIAEGEEYFETSHASRLACMEHIKILENGGLGA